jgi:hypothetical protein
MDKSLLVRGRQSFSRLKADAENLAQSRNTVAIELS